MSKIFYVIPVLIFFVGTMCTLYQVDMIRSDAERLRVLDQTSQKLSQGQESYKKDIAWIINRKKTLNDTKKKILTSFRMVTQSYSQNTFRNEVDSRAQKYGLIIEEFSFDNNQADMTQGLQTDTFKIQLFGEYLDFIRFFYVLAEKFSNLDIQQLSFSRQNIYQAKVRVLVKGHLYKYVQ